MAVNLRSSPPSFANNLDNKADGIGYGLSRTVRTRLPTKMPKLEQQVGCEATSSKAINFKASTTHSFNCIHIWLFQHHRKTRRGFTIKDNDYTRSTINEPGDQIRRDLSISNKNILLAFKIKAFDPLIKAEKERLKTFSINKNRLRPSFYRRGT